MEVNKYEQTYKCVKVAMDTTKYVDRVVDFLRNAPAPVSCKELGTALFGDDYKQFPKKEVYDGYMCIDHDKRRHNERAQSLASSLGHMMSNLMREGLVKLTKEKGEPVTIELEDYVTVYDGEVCKRSIEVWDAKGNKYEMVNPNFSRGHGEWRKVPTIITPTVKKYSLV
jgi:hypothetical protein